jgi:hypothetical protein
MVEFSKFYRNSISRILCITLLFILQPYLMGLDVEQPQFVKIEEKQSSKNPSITKYKLKFKKPNSKKLHSQTVSYLSHEALKKDIEKSYRKNLSEFDHVFLENLINNAINKELEFHKDCFVFYHGQKLEFMLFQDLFTKLYAIIFNKKLTDFFMLRIPGKKFTRFKTIKRFINHYQKKGKIKNERIDRKDFAQKMLLSVNPSLFANNQRPTSCSFSFFLNSKSATTTNFMDLVKKTFDYFNISEFFEKYKYELEKLTNTLSSPVKGKTGLLLQIFIPKKAIDDLAYLSKPGGKLYPKLLNPNRVYIELKKYQHNIFSPFTNYLNPFAIDKLQLRLLINDRMLNPDCGIKMFRYYNETENVKKYKEQFNKLIDQIKFDLKNKF